MDIIQSIIEEIKEKANDWFFIAAHREKQTSFSKTHGKVSAADTIFFVLSLIKTTLGFEIENQVATNSMKNVVPSTVTKARKKLLYTAFEAILGVIVSRIPVAKTYKGYRIVATDGTDGSLPKTPELMAKYNASGASYPKFAALSLTDVLNNIIIGASFHPFPCNERQSAMALVRKYIANTADTPSILLLDRGFPSLEVIHQLETGGIKYVMRASAHFLKEVNEFTKSEEFDETVDINYSKRRGATNRVSGVELPYSFNIRCVKIELIGGQTETLITNLPEGEFSQSDVGVLYNMRWGIETSFNHLKNAVHIEEFVGTLENCILQEFYASLIVYNLSSLCINAAQADYDKKNEIYQVQIPD